MINLPHPSLSVGTPARHTHTQSHWNLTFLTSELSNRQPPHTSPKHKQCLFLPSLCCGMMRLHSQVYFYTPMSHPHTDKEQWQLWTRRRPRPFPVKMHWIMKCRRFCPEVKHKNCFKESSFNSFFFLAHPSRRLFHSVRVRWRARHRAGEAALRHALPVGGPPVSVPDGLHPDAGGAVVVQVLLPGPLAGLLQPAREPGRAGIRGGRLVPPGVLRRQPHRAGRGLGAGSLHDPGGALQRPGHLHRQQ